MRDASAKPDASPTEPVTASVPAASVVPIGSAVAATSAAPEPLRVVVVDDEPLARWRLVSLVLECAEPAAVVVDQHGDAAGALAAANPDWEVVLLDIQMPGVGGLELARDLRRRFPALEVVFVTAHGEHALQAFDVGATDYLTKPVRRERLQQALVRAADRVAVRRASMPGPADVGPAADEPVLVATAHGTLVRVPWAEVLYLKAELKYVTARTATGTHLLDESLSELEARLGDRVLRIHRNALVVPRAVRRLAQVGTAVDGGQSVGAGRHSRRGAGAAAQNDVDHPAPNAVELGDPAHGEDAGPRWAVQVHPTGEWLRVSRRQLPAVRALLART